MGAVSRSIRKQRKEKKESEISIQQSKTRAFVEGTGDFPVNVLMWINSTGFFMLNGKYFTVNEKVIINNEEYMIHEHQKLKFVSEDKLRYPMPVTVLIGIALTLLLVIPAVLFFFVFRGHLLPNKEISIDEMMKLSPSSFKEHTIQEARTLVKDNFDEFADEWPVSDEEISKFIQDHKNKH